MRAAVQELPATAGIGLANWNWKVVHQVVLERLGISLCRSSCLNYLHRLGFVLKRPKKRLVKANEARREASVAASPPCETMWDALVPFPLEYALYRIFVSPVSHSCASRNPELEAAFQYQQI